MLDSTRRSFLTWCAKLAGGGILFGLTVPLLQSCEPTSLPLGTVPAQLPIGPDGRYTVDISDLSSSNPIKLVTELTGTDNLPVLISRVTDTDFRALSSLCTHANCEVQGRLEDNAIPCLCHGSRFNLDGSVRIGPATTPLKQYDAIVDLPAKQIHIKLG